ncbi:MAG TPA: RIP metalloprotease RseP [Candidatus Paceibacterota bacterium]|nr:RIP metalloprotease RseP [Candidatus Paceibacterota bacterium]
MSVIIFLIILLVLVVSHEFGHFIVAKKSGIRVDEFSFGFPPKLFGIKRGETTYKFNALPFGGYVKIYGQGSDDFPGQNSEKVTTESDQARSFMHKPRYIQAMVLLAGVVMNFLVAWLLLSIGFMSGLPTSSGATPTGSILANESLTIISLASGSPAEKAGLKIGDKIILLESGKDMTETPSAESVQYFVKRHGGENINISVVRAKELKQFNVIPEINKTSNTPMIGISMDVIGTLKLPIHKAVWEGLKLSSDIFIGTIKGFYTLIHDGLTGHGNLSAISGPVGIVGVVGDAAKFGFIYLLSFTALISINLAVINLIPFPALDGGRLLFLLIEKIKGSRIKPEIANLANMIGFGLLMLLMAVITFHDIVKLF